MKQTILLTIVALLSTSGLAPGVTRLVPDEYATIQAGIDDSNDGDTIIVADGIYTGEGNRDINFFGKAIILQSENGPEKCIIDCNSTQTDQHFGVAFGSGEEADSVLDGFTIINGYVIGGCWPSLCEWGGIICSYSSPTIRNCIVSHNAGYGIDCTGGDAIIRNCIISNNNERVGSRGGGIYCSSGDLIISNCVISDNKGRGIACFNGNFIVIECTIIDNMDGGMCFWNANLMVKNCTISGNRTSVGGGIECCESSGTISSCVIGRNSAGNQGGGIYCWRNSTPNIVNCLITRNTANFGGGGIECSDGSSPMIINCTIVNNHVRQYGGGIYCYLSYPTISNSILWANSTELEGPQIALRHTGWPSSLTISFCDVQGGETAAYVEPECTLNWGDGNIEADPCFGDPNNGDYHLKSQAGRWNPNSQSWIKDDVTSPCIDAGNPVSPIGHESFPNGGLINMGAYGGTAEASKSYFGEPVCKIIVAGDINGDCNIDWLDFRFMALNWLKDYNPKSPPPPPPPP